MSQVIGIGPTEQAALVDEPTKAFSTLRARCYLAGIAVSRSVDAGTVRFYIAGRAFSTVEAAEDELDRLLGDSA